MLEREPTVAIQIARRGCDDCTYAIQSVNARRQR